ncbi:MAG: cell division protein FtsL [Lachnospiraceae bacterium]|nr:cell division protein FtsL [Lachnospiraceae bacterium]
MAVRQGRQYENNRTGRRPQKKTTSMDHYVEGNAVRKLDVRTEREERKIEKTRTRVRKNRDIAFHMNFPYVFFLTVAMVLAGVILVKYIELQSDITSSIKQISRMESQLNDLEQTNDEEYSKITSSIDLEEIKRIAIYELGMQYAEKGQIIGYQGNGSDYVRQYSDIKN